MPLLLNQVLSANGRIYRNWPRCQRNRLHDRPNRFGAAGHLDKIITGGTITDISVAISITLGTLEATDATVHAQLYIANPFNAREYQPMPNKLMNIVIPYAAPIGGFYTASLTGLSVNIAPEDQFVIGFHSTSTNVTWVNSSARERRSKDDHGLNRKMSDVKSVS